VRLGGGGAQLNFLRRGGGRDQLERDQPGLVTLVVWRHDQMRHPPGARVDDEIGELAECAVATRDTGSEVKQHSCNS
jgi:hypothetical protein